MKILMSRDFVSRDIKNNTRILGRKICSNFLMPFMASKELSSFDAINGIKKLPHILRPKILVLFLMSRDMRIFIIPTSKGLKSHSKELKNLSSKIAAKKP